MGVALNRQIRAITSRRDFHDLIDSIGDGDHAVLLIAKTDEGETNEREIDVRFMNVSAWQAEGLLRFGIRCAYSYDEGEE